MRSPSQTLGALFPKDMRLENTDTLGLQLITALVGQLGARIDLQREPHPVFTIRF
jgi:two-component sensor histidine kinase